MSNQRENSWRAGCNESCTSGSVGEFRKSTSRCKIFSHILDEAHLDSTLHVQKNIDLNEELISNPVATFFVRVKGHSMKNASINDEDVLIVDRSLPVKNGDIVVAVIDGELTVKRFNKLKDRIILQAENPDFPPIVIANERDFSIWGVATTVIHSLKPTRLA